MKVFLDDLRPCPDGWVLVRTASEAILSTLEIEEI